MSDATKLTLVDKEPLTAALIEQWNTIGSVLDGLTPDQWSAPSPLPGWSIHDVTSHLIGTESLLSGIEPPVPEDAVPASDHVHNPIGKYNERWVIGLRDHTPTDLLAAFRDITVRRAEALNAMTQADFDAPALTPAGADTYGRFMRIRLFDCWIHEHDIRDAVALPGDEGGPRAEYALSEIETGLGFAVGKKGRAPQGSSVTFDLSGPLARRIHVSVDGRAAVVPDLGGPASTTLGMDSRLFTRMCAGRVDPRDHLGEIVFAGDAELGSQVATNLAFTI